MSKIEWTNETWNPIIGCSKISEGCKECYAEKMAYRLAHMEMNNCENQYNYVNVIDFKTKKWNGKTKFAKSQLDKPLNRKKPTIYFVCSMGDLFHESVPFEWIDKVMAVIARSTNHTFQILTKRPERMFEYFTNSDRKRLIHNENCNIGKPVREFEWPLKNVLLGVTAENQEMANKRIPILLQIPAKVHFVSVEPMLGHIDISICFYSGYMEEPFDDIIDWVICGGETGTNARPLHPDWVRSLRDQCAETNTPFFFKQWGEWYPSNENEGIMHKIGKRLSGSTLDGKIYKEFPK